LRSGILVIDCPDRPRLVAAIAQFLYAHGGNILHADQHPDNEAGKCFMRIEWSLDPFDLDEAAFRQQFTRLADEFRMVWGLAWARHRLRIALFVSRYQHCLIDLLHRHQIGELAGDIALVVSNHRDSKSLAAFYGVPFPHFPLTSADKPEVEAQQINLLENIHVDLVVLARDMQVLSLQLVARLPERIINVHTPFFPPLPAPNPTMRRSSVV
jgi:formyltetrahydrofolate deformylase